MDVVRLAKSVVMLHGLPGPLRVGIYGLAGVAVGMALLLVRIANGTSYLSDKPETCMNCHVMTDAYASWQRGSHGRVAVCVDCHVPHSNLVAKYAFKSPRWDEAFLRVHHEKRAAGAGPFGRGGAGGAGQLRAVSRRRAVDGSPGRRDRAAMLGLSQRTFTARSAASRPRPRCFGRDCPRRGWTG